MGRGFFGYGVMGFGLVVVVIFGYVGVFGLLLYGYGMYSRVRLIYM